MQIQTLRGVDYLYVTTTTTHEVYRANLASNTISVFADRSHRPRHRRGSRRRTDQSGQPGHRPNDGSICIVEDRNGGVDDDIWFAKDLNHDGDLNDAGGGIGRWASNGTLGSEFTVLYFDPTNKRRAWVNIQHPASGNDRTLETAVP